MQSYNIPIVLFIFLLVQLSYQASFYGSSYVKLPVQDASSSTNIYVRFKTHRADALLLLAAGTTDYCLVTLQDGAIRVRINLGAGETELSSPASLRLDDLMWHQVEIQRDDAEISLIVDEIHSSHHFIPGSFYELNVDYGIFCGGLGDFTDLFLGNLRSFRGCMEEVSFNDYDVLGTSDQTISHRVSWDCSSEFDDVDLEGSSSISFMSKVSFLALPQMSLQNGGSLGFDVKTQTQTAVMAYHSGIPSRSDFIGLELVNGVAKLLVDRGDGVVVVPSNVTISDGYWHSVTASFRPDELTLTVDGVTVSLHIKRKGNYFIDLNGYFYVGGIELNKQSRALRQGMESVDQEGTESSIRGCIRNLMVNQNPRRLFEAEVTQDLQSGCVWYYPCLFSPCITGGECYQESYDGFRCFCDAGELCVRHDYNETYTVYTKSTSPVDLEILQLNPLQVNEGGSELVTTDLIQVILDYQRYGIRETGVKFHIIEAPKFGALEVEIWQRSSENVFTLSDLSTEKIRYRHYGSDDHHDTVTFEIQFIGDSHRLPPFLDHNHKFVFHINVIPVNDPPYLKIPQDKVLRLAARTKKLITSVYLKTIDTDSPPSELVYTVVSHGSTGDSSFVENIKNPGISITKFTQMDVDNNLISYVHRGSNRDSRLTLRVTDGVKSELMVNGDDSVLRIATFDLYISLANNTGVTCVHGASARISSSNLTFITNAIDQQLDISYDITRMPQHGTVQKLKSSGRWQVTSRFTQRQIDNNQVRYEHAGNSRPRQDQFKFVVSSTSTKQDTVYDFTVSFITVNVDITGTKQLRLYHLNQAPLSQQELYITTSPNIPDESGIGFQLISGLSHGEILVKGTDGHMTAQKPFGDHFAFTLEDIVKNNVVYVMKWRMYVPVNDTFTLMAVTPGGIRNNIVINVVHVPMPSNVLVLVRPITVQEGQKVTIRTDNLRVTEPNVTSFIFNITRAPLHGGLLLLEEDLRTTEISGPEVISSRHIDGNRFVYVHDDSENIEDSFEFVAFAGEWSNSETLVHGSLQIKVVMKNDNPPIRAVERPFYVVKFGKRLVTSKDLQYSDEDIDTKSSEIQYTRRAISNGMIYNVKNPQTEIFQFTQADIDNGEIMFQHKGSLEGRTVLWVTDGQFYTTGILEINASDPFIVISTNEAPVMKHGDSMAINSSYLDITTNVYASTDRIVYKIKRPSKYGQVTRRGISSLEFTQSDLDKGLVEYESDTALEFVDSFQFDVAVSGKISTRGEFNIKIYPEAYWKPFVIVKNEMLNVPEGKRKLVDKGTLRISHSNVDQNEIMFNVVEPPKAGVLYIDNFKHVRTFSQATINDNKLKYEQTFKNITSDSIVFDVTNGVITLRNFTLEINIIPNRIDLLPGQLKVLEGNELKIELGYLKLSNKYYSRDVRDFLITTKPRYGRLQNKRKPRKRITRFSPTQLRRGLIYYVHDGSETAKDRFSIVAVVATENGIMRSSPGHIDVLVLPVDDQPPVLVNNTGLITWYGLTSTLTNSMLAATDVDSNFKDINFRIVESSNIGYFGLVSSPEQFLTLIPQSKINSGDVKFYHTGGDDGSFVFELTDMVNTLAEHVTFKVIAKPIELLLENLQRVQVFPKMQGVISNHNLQVLASGNISSHGIIFEVLKPPVHGKLLIKDGKLFDHVTEFTQAEVDEDLIMYQSIEKQHVNDTIVFEVFNEYSQKSLKVTLPIEISGKINEESLHGIVTPVELMEGSSATINENNLNINALLRLIPSVESEYSIKDTMLVIEHQPKHGYILCNSKRLDLDESLCETTVQQFINGKIVYQHDHSDTFLDSIDFGVKITNNLNDEMDLINITLRIRIIPVNDNGFQFVTEAPEIDVVYGMHAEISKSNFYTEDRDGMPESIVYNVKSEATNGYFELLKDGIKHRVSSFTQLDIDDGNLYFMHDGSSETNSYFNFKVSDGSPDHKAVYKKCLVNVLPLTLKIIEKTDLKITQGKTKMVLANSHIRIATNGNASLTIYKVQVKPTYGDIQKDGKLVTEFTQDDIDNEIVVYSQNDLSGFEDNFTLGISNVIASATDQVFLVKVEPLLNQRNSPYVFAQKTFISLKHLDASELAQTTDSNPMYSIIHPPKYGILQRAKQRPYRSVENLQSFTHSDIKNNFIYYEFIPKKGNSKISDDFVFLLSAPNVQPAKGRISIRMNPNFGPTSHPTNSILSENSATISGIPSESSGAEMEGNYLLVVAVVIGLLVFLIVVVIVVFRCLRKNRSSKKSTYQQNKYSPKNGVLLGVSDDLPPPPGSNGKQYPPAGQTIGMYSEDDYATEISAAVPMCKVIPLTEHHISDCHSPKNPQFDEPDSLYSDDMSINSNIGHDNHWSGIGLQETQFSPPSNPLLRKNQYWV